MVRLGVVSASVALISQLVKARLQGKNLHREDGVREFHGHCEKIIVMVVFWLLVCCPVLS